MCFPYINIDSDIYIKGNSFLVLLLQNALADNVKFINNLKLY